MFSIWIYGYDTLGLSKAWRHERDVDWETYEAMSTTRPGEGVAWKATFNY